MTGKSDKVYPVKIQATYERKRMYLRELRMLFNRAKENGVTTHYPFIKGRDGYNIPKGKGRKIALNKPELQKIFDFT